LNDVGDRAVLRRNPKYQPRYYKEKIMLVLSRYRDESIYIGDDVVITVVDIRGDRVRIGVQAPPNVSVHRQEVYEAIKNDSRKPERAPSAPVSESKATASAPLGQELNKRKAKMSVPKALPVDIESPVEFGGLGNVVSR
jgi:carbon storage regulator